MRQNKGKTFSVALSQYKTTKIKDCEPISTDIADSDQMDAQTDVNKPDTGS